MTAKVILNPYSGRWNARKRWPAAAAALEQAGVAYDLAITERPGQATELAAQAVHAGFAPIIVASGDGTVGEVVNGLAQAVGNLDDRLPSIGILPLGTANDVADTIGLPRDERAVAHVIAAGRTRLMDVGQANGRLFVNNAAVGLDPYVGMIQQRMRFIHGSLRYLLAALRGVADCPRWTMHLEWEGGQYSGPLTLVAIGNGPRSGGIFYTAPHADPFDGRLTFVFGYRPSRWQLLRALPRTLRPGAGSYVELDGISEIHTTWLRVRAEQPSPAQTDGEIMGMAAQTLEYRILPARLPVLVGGSESGGAS